VRRADCHAPAFAHTPLFTPALHDATAATVKVRNAAISPPRPCPSNIQQAMRNDDAGARCAKVAHIVPPAAPPRPAHPINHRPRAQRRLAVVMLSAASSHLPRRQRRRSCPPAIPPYHTSPAERRPASTYARHYVMFLRQRQAHACAVCFRLPASPRWRRHALPGCAGLCVLLRCQRCC